MTKPSKQTPRDTASAAAGWVKRWRRVFHGFLYLIAFLILGFAIVVNVLRVTLPHVSRWQTYLEHWASQTLHQPVRFDGMEAHFRGLNPTFRFTNVVVYNHKQTKVLWHLNELSINVSVWRSMLHRQLQPAAVFVSGADVKIKQLSSRHYRINHFDYFVDQASNGKSEMPWWALGVDLRLHNIKVNWRDKNNHHIDMAPINVHVVPGVANYHIAGALVLKQLPSTVVHFVLAVPEQAIIQHQADIQFYAHAENMILPQWQKLLSWYHKTPIAIHSGQANVSVWGQWQSHQLKNLRSQLTLNNLTVQAPQLSHPWRIRHVSTDVFWQHKALQSQLYLSHMRSDDADLDWRDDQISWQKKMLSAKLPPQYTLNVSHLNGRVFHSWVNTWRGAPKKWRTPLAALNPTGDARDIRLQWQNHHVLSASLMWRGLSWRPWKKIPGIKDVNGYLWWTPQVGALHLSGVNTVLSIPNIYHHPLALTYFSMPVVWRQSASGQWQVFAPMLLQQDKLTCRGQLRLSWQHAQSPVLDFLMGIDDQQVGQLAPLFPTHVMSPHLHRWLSGAFLSGQAKHGVMVFRGPLLDFPFAGHQGHFLVGTQLTDVHFHYLDRWPDLTQVNGQLVFNNNQMHFESDHGVMGSVKVTHIMANIPRLSRSKLTVQAKLSGDLKDASAEVQRMPIQAAGALSRLSFSGPMRLNLGLHIQLYGKHNAHSNGDIITHDGHLFVPSYALSLNKMNGVVHFKDNSLSANNVSAQLLGGQAALSLKTQQLKQKTFLGVDLSGRYRGDDLRRYLKLGQQSFWRGRGGLYRANLSIPTNDDKRPTTVNVNLDGRGVGFYFPSPLSKSVTSSDPLSVFLSLYDDGRIRSRIGLDKRWQMAALFQRQKTSNRMLLDRMQLALGEHRAVLPMQPGLFVSGDVRNLNLTLWQQWLAGQKSGQNQAPVRIPAFKRATLFCRHLRYKKWSLSDISFDLRDQLKVWQLQLAAPVIVGHLAIPKLWPRGTFTAKLDRLNLNAFKLGHATGTLLPHDLPNLDLQVNHFQYAAYHFDRMRVQAYHDLRALRFKTLEFAAGDYALNAIGAWQQDRGKTKTQLQGQLSSDNFGRLLSSQHYTDMLKEGRGTLSFALSWPSSPWRLRWPQVNGKLAVNMTDGRIVKLSSQSESELGLGKVLGLLSLQTLPRRLSLNFDDLFKSGYSFDHWRGDWQMKTGRATTSNSEVSGSVAKVNLQGLLDFVHKNYDFNLQVQPHVTGSLPVIAAIVGTPIIGAVTWAVNKVVLSPLVGQLMESRYHVTGTWAKPSVKDLGSRRLAVPALTTKTPKKILPSPR